MGIFAMSFIVFCFLLAFRNAYQYLQPILLWQMKLAHHSFTLFNAPLFSFHLYIILYIVLERNRTKKMHSHSLKISMFTYPYCHFEYNYDMNEL